MAAAGGDEQHAARDREKMRAREAIRREGEPTLVELGGVAVAGGDEQQAAVEEHVKQPLQHHRVRNVRHLPARGPGSDSDSDITMTTTTTITLTSARARTGTTTMTTTAIREEAESTAERGPRPPAQGPW